jgi:hypothetical protein
MWLWVSEWLFLTPTQQFLSYIMARTSLFPLDDDEVLQTNLQPQGNRIVGEMTSVLSLSVVDRGFELRSGQTKDYKIGICFFSAKHTF